MTLPRLLYDVFGVASAGSLILPLSAGIVRFKHLCTTQIILFLYSVFSIVTDVLTFLTKGYPLQIVLQNVFTLVEGVCFLLAYAIEFFTPLVKKAAYFSLIVFGVTLIGIILAKSSDSKPTGVPGLIESSLLLLVSIVYLFEKLTAPPDTPMLTDSFFFWVNAAILLYFATSLLPFLFNDYLAKHRGEAMYFITLQRVVNIIFNCLLAVGLWKRKAI